jgi:hypothetical protein
MADHALKTQISIKSRTAVQFNRNRMIRLPLSIVLVISAVLQPLWAQSLGRKEQGSPPVPPCRTFSSGTSATTKLPTNSAAPEVASYVDQPIEQLKRMVPGLGGIRIERVEKASAGTGAMPAQDKTALVLNRTSAVIAGLLYRMPNLIAKEEVKEPTDTAWENDLPHHAFQNVWEGPAQQEIPTAHLRTRVYTYRIVHEKMPGGGDAFNELRTDAHDEPIDSSVHDAEIPFSVGFATTWLFFLPDNLQGSNFRYLGMQKIDDRETYALAFAQNPEQKGLDVVVESSYGRCTTPIQGVAWIDQSTFQIVRMQTDLLTPLPGIQLNQFRSILDYGAVKIPESKLSLWLPSEVETTWQTAYGAGAETHLYSHYRLFGSTAKILPGFSIPPK